MAPVDADRHTFLCQTIPIVLPAINGLLKSCPYHAPPWF
jgi:hypothetical protein